jgi:hypothetical protein
LVIGWRLGDLGIGGLGPDDAMATLKSIDDLGMGDW